LRFINEEIELTNYPYEFVTLKNGNKLTYKDWENKVEANFEKYFWIGNKGENEQNNQMDYKLVKRENIYKDVVYCTNKNAEYQHRPNYLIAMAVAPELFNKDNALKALEQYEKHLLVKEGMGVRSLDREDPGYRGDYENSNDSNDYNIAQGFNYHNVRTMT